MFERESHREKILEARAKELRVKAKQKAIADSGPAETEGGKKPLAENIGAQKDVSDGKAMVNGQ